MDPTPALTDWLVAQLRSDGAIGIDTDDLARGRIAEAAAAAVAAVRAGGEGLVEVPFASVGPKGPLHLKVAVTASFLEALAPGGGPAG